MPVKWKVYLALNFLLAIPSLSLLIYLLIEVFSSKYYMDKADPGFLSVTCLSLLIIVLNNFFGIVLFQRYYAGTRVLPPAIKRINIVLLILMWMVVLILAAVTSYGASEEFGSESDDGDPAGKIAVFVLSFVLISQAAILVMQAKLSTLIQRNNRKSMQELIDNIGQ